MNPDKNHREDIARALILCANVYLEMDMDSSDEDIDGCAVEDDDVHVDDSPPKDVSNASVSALSVPKWSNDEYKHYLKISGKTFDFVHRLVAPRLRRLCHGMPMVNARLQIMVALHKLTSSNTYRDASAAFNMKKSTGYLCTNRVISALSALAPAFVQWPPRAAAGGVEGCGLPGGVANVGCCRLPVLQLLGGSKEGVLFQVICDSKQKIIHCDITPPNTDIIQHSRLSEYLGDPTKFPDNTHLIANNSYPLHENIMVPYEEENSDDIQSNFNKTLRSAYVVDKCMGSLLTRFESLTRGLSLNEKANKRHVLACCVLHNICILKNDFCNGRLIAKLVEDSTSSEACPKGMQKRDAIARELPLG